MLPFLISHIKKLLWVSNFWLHSVAMEEQIFRSLFFMKPPMKSIFTAVPENLFDWNKYVAAVNKLFLGNFDEFPREISLIGIKDCKHPLFCYSRQETQGDESCELIRHRAALMSLPWSYMKRCWRQTLLLCFLFHNKHLSGRRRIIFPHLARKSVNAITRRVTQTCQRHINLTSRWLVKWERHRQDTNALSRPIYACVPVVSIGFTGSVVSNVNEILNLMFAVLRRRRWYSASETNKDLICLSGKTYNCVIVNFLHFSKTQRLTFLFSDFYFRKRYCKQRNLLPLILLLSWNLPLCYMKHNLISLF